MADQDGSPEGNSGANEDIKAKMREALERKQAKVKAAHGEDHKSGHGVGYAANDNRKRQFRRKAGG